MATPYIHPEAIVEGIVEDGTRVWAFTHIMKHAHVGNNCNIGEGCFIENGVMIGNGTTVKNGVAIWTGVIVEDDVFIGPNVAFTNDLRPRAWRRLESFASTRIKCGASLGANATIICGITLGEYCMIGAGAVITKDVPAYALMVGVPARLIGYVCRCGQKLARQADNNLLCSGCSLTYAFSKGILVPSE